MKKPPFILIIILILSSCSIGKNIGETKSFQCKVDSVWEVGRNKIKFIAYKMGSGEKVELWYGFPSFSTRNIIIKRGIWITVSYNPKECVDGIVNAKIKVNK